MKKDTSFMISILSSTSDEQVRRIICEHRYEEPSLVEVIQKKKKKIKQKHEQDEEVVEDAPIINGHTQRKHKFSFSLNSFSSTAST